ncbi:MULTISPECIES: adenylate/guanylate cyclase domain-containing protein [unclassified Rhizobium]|uniref:adenylate/guanylate cyclase domain-containing protein n=1 Tax=unclassified Rhizobium TaxID=2613769 RepID=UPI001ADA51C0|nr:MULTISPECIES: adenylate/guanylate cyclase domain-containing protein [unclassified Rhizobium]MBO9123409.1 adenylate/guanylate cyclase domain-containing protein [Rhizobium sp. 16-488-2b]MBO9173941.1 adenylate/guanylate cyclase domain-containing protein [Rhizobium sp. 16-488-2a]
MREVSPVQNWLLIMLVMAGSGVLYSVMFFQDSRPLIGAVFALCMGMPIIAFERKVIFRGLRNRVEALPTLTFFLAELFIYEVLMSIGFAAAGLSLWGTGIVIPHSWVDMVVLPFNAFLYALAVCSLMIFVLRVRELLGREVFTSMLISRYRKPVSEERVFLFIDLVDSTTFAEKHGDLRAQQMLSSLFAAFAEPVRKYKGTIVDYVGDAAIITWPLDRGVKFARCVNCIFDIINAIEADAESWLTTYGQVPRLRAALHGGSIITAEIGIDHHKITYFGDTINTASRLESLCKTLNRSVLISTDLAQRIQLPAKVVAEDLGQHAVKGRGQSLGVISLVKADDRIASPKLHAGVKAPT